MGQGIDGMIGFDSYDRPALSVYDCHETRAKLNEKSAKHVPWGQEPCVACLSPFKSWGDVKKSDFSALW